MIYVILAMDDANGIGKNNSIPWHSSADFEHFKQLTTGHTIVMGANTWDSLPKKPLPNRINIVVTSGTRDNCTIITPDNIIDKLSSIQDDVFVIGGAMLINSVIDICDELIITRIPGDFDCDVKLGNIFDSFSVRSTKSLSDGLIVQTYVRK